MAGMICVRPGRETRLIYRTQMYRGRAGEQKGFRAREFADLLTSARQQLGDLPLIVVWENASAHHAKPLREFCERNSDWLTIVKLPPYAPDLNPVAALLQVAAAGVVGAFRVPVLVVGCLRHGSIAYSGLDVRQHEQRAKQVGGSGGVSAELGEDPPVLQVGEAAFDGGRPAARMRLASFSAGASLRARVALKPVRPRGHPRRRPGR
ncbi:hypothetical protein GCM10010448_59300 [Streptomyces glomeratus]|uniref:Tc1-like transposase DDE domain-containing protein n=1 Tax=Streptomyces glomeratus TaxID=284452 RepID=A0ABP6LYZ0_9ACTN